MVLRVIAMASRCRCRVLQPPLDERGLGIHSWLRGAGDQLSAEHPLCESQLSTADLAVVSPNVLAT